VASRFRSYGPAKSGFETPPEPDVIGGRRDGKVPLVFRALSNAVYRITLAHPVRPEMAAEKVHFFAFGAP